MTLSDLIALIALLVVVGGGAITIILFVRNARAHQVAPRTTWIRLGITVITACLIVAVVLAVEGTIRNSDTGRTPVGDIFASSSPTPSATDTPVPTATPMPTATATATAVPTATPIPRPGTILYQTDWSKGFDGWGASKDWKTYNGMLVNDGTHSEDYCAREAIQPSLVPPYQPSTPDYSVEVQVQMVRGDGNCSNSFGIDARAVAGDRWTGYTGSVGPPGDGGAYISDFNNDLAHTGFDPGTAWHTYRFEVHGTNMKLFVDNGLILATSDAKYLTTPGQIGLWDMGIYLYLRSCVVKQL